MKQVKGRNGGTLKAQEKGDPGLPGAGRPPGSKSFKTLLEEALEKVTTNKDGIDIPIKEESVLQLVAMVISEKTDSNTKLKAFQLIRDTIGEAPVTKNEHSGPNGGDIPLKTWIIEVPAPPPGLIPTYDPDKTSV